MLKFLLLLLPLACLGGAPAQAADPQRSPKKAAADQDAVKLPPPQVLENGDTLAGLRLSTGSAFGGAALFGANVEHLFTDNIGGALQFDYGSYTTSFGIGTVTGEWKTKAWSIAAMGTFHADLFKVPNLDPYVSVGLGRSFVSVTWTSNLNLPEPVGADSSSFFLVAYLNARYFLSSSWGVSASLGTGFGTFGLGADYVF